MNEQNQSENIIIKRIGGHLHKIIPIVDRTGKILHHVIQPFQVEFKFRDIFQVVVGASILMVPVAFTEEVWILSEQLPVINIALLSLISISIIAVFVFHSFYHSSLKGNVINYIKRVVGTYIVSLMAVAVFLTIIDKCPWGIDNFLGLKRIILIGFPASMCGTLSDAMK
jgi:uncharacterized membrane protein